MKRNVFFRAIGLTLLLIPSISFSQNLQKVPETPSANAINLGIFGEVPISMYAGLPDISVPVFEIKAKNFTVPISINYHASGVRPEVHPSWCGMGWSTNCGGAITREIRGKADEARCVDNQDCLPKEAGYLYYNGQQNDRSDWASDDYLKDYRYGSFAIDYEPDLFNFSFPGHSGVFFLDQTGIWRVQSDKPLKVIFEANDFIEPWFNPVVTWHAGKTFNKFTIVDEVGNRYIFGTANAIEYSSELITKQNDPEQRYKGTATSWFLIQMISADGYDKIDFTYERGPYQSAIYKTVNNEAIFNPGNCDNFSSPQFLTSGKITSPVYLTSVNYAKTGLTVAFGMDKSNELNYGDNDFIDLFRDAGNSSVSDLLRYTNGIPYFTRNPPNTSLDTWKWAFVWMRLNAIDIYDNVQPIKTLILNYDNTATERLHLSSVDVKKDFYHQFPEYKYAFEYYNNYPLPNYLTTLGDAWGFYNSSPLLTQTTIDGGEFLAAKQITDLNHAINGSLKSITYPTKGKSTIEYEQHHFGATVSNTTRKLTGASGVAGGLRVKSIKTVDNNGNEDVKNYYYVDNYTPTANVATLPSSGILEAEPVFGYSATVLDYENHPFTFDYFSSNLIVPATSSSGGQHISYSTVVEQRSDGAYSIFKYTNHDRTGTVFGDVIGEDRLAVNQFNGAIFPYIPYNSRAFERGKLLTKVVYDKSGNAMQSETYEYQRPDNFGFENYAARAIQQSYKDNCLDRATRSSIARAAYLIYYNPVYIKSITNWERGNASASDDITTVKTFAYNWEWLTSNETITNSKGEQISTDYHYAYNDISAMRSKNMLDLKNYTQVSVAGTPVSLSTIDYGDSPEDPGNYYPRTVKQRARYGDPQDVVLQFNSYEGGNVRQQTLKSGVIESFDWGYNKTLPVAKVVNAQNNYVDYFVPKTTATTVAVLRTTSTRTFTTYYTGNITLTIQLTSPPTTGFSVMTDLSGTGGYRQAISLCFAYGTYGCGPNSPSTITYTDVPPGTYTLTEFTDQVVFATLDYSYQDRQEIISGVKEFYLINFEDGGTASSINPHTGMFCSNGASVTVSWPRPNSRTYVYSYFYRTAGAWKYSGELPYTTSSVVLNNGDAYDDIRIYPKDAMMTSYTYNPTIGVTSTIDEKGKTAYFSYDDFERLQHIKDQDGNIIQSLQYNYKQ
jgi:hypothetical protein